MSLFAVLLSLVLEQLKPLRRDSRVHQALIAWVGWSGRNFDAGKPHHAALVWGVAVLAPTLVVLAVFLGLQRFHAALGLLFSVGVLYLTLGFRPFSHYVGRIRDCLERGDEAGARALLAEWRHLDTSELPRTEVLRHVIEHALLSAHRHVFGVLFWYVLLSTLGLGPAGAVLYRMAEFTSRYWGFRSRTLGEPVNERLQATSQHLFELVDHVPCRLTASGFAVVGNFEEAVNGWRRDAALWTRPNEGVVLASAAGALGVQLGGQTAPGMSPDRAQTFSRGSGADFASAAGSTPGVPLQLGHLQNVIALVWRSVVLWLLLLALLTVANLLG